MSNNIVECTVERCIHNMSGMCNAQYIHVVGDNTQQSYQTDCHTFELKSYRSSVINMTNVNITGAVDQIFTEDPVMNPSVRCSVGNCFYNINLQGCSATRIEIDGPGAGTIQQTNCSTFRRR